MRNRTRSLHRRVSSNRARGMQAETDARDAYEQGRLTGDLIGLRDDPHADRLAGRAAGEPLGRHNSPSFAMIYQAKRSMLCERCKALISPGDFFTSSAKDGADLPALAICSRCCTPTLATPPIGANIEW